MMIVLAILLGGFFGFALYKVGAANMDNLLSMLSLRNLTLMKIIPELFMTIQKKLWTD